ncbi:hypothetical protein ACNQFZ_02185 [Schinkia sp. CFF1]
MKTKLRSLGLLAGMLLLGNTIVIADEMPVNIENFPSQFEHILFIDSTHCSYLKVIYACYNVNVVRNKNTIETVKTLTILLVML